LSHDLTKHPIIINKYGNLKPIVFKHVNFWQFEQMMSDEHDDMTAYIVEKEGQVKVALLNPYNYRVVSDHRYA